MKRSETEIYDQITRAQELQNEGSIYPAMSYEDGVLAALDWIIGHTI